MVNMLRKALCMMAAVALLAGCGGEAAEKVAETIAEYAIGESSVVDIGFKMDGGTMTIQTEEGEAKITVGARAEVPRNIPKDVPIYPGITVQGSRSMEASGTFSIQAKSADGPDKILNFYKKEATAQGWTETMSMNQSGVHILAYEKGDRVLNINVMPSKTGSNLQIMTMKK